MDNISQFSASCPGKWQGGAFIYGLLSVTRYYTVLNDQVTTERKIGNDVEGSICGPISDDVLEFA